MAGVGHANNSGAHCWQLLCLEPWMNPSTRHERRSGRRPGGAWTAPLQLQQGQNKPRQSPGMRNWTKCFRKSCSRLTRKTPSKVGANLGRRIPIVRLVTTKAVDGI